MDRDSIGRIHRPLYVEEAASAPYAGIILQGYCGTLPV